MLLCQCHHLYCTEVKSLLSLLPLAAPHCLHDLSRGTQMQKFHIDTKHRIPPVYDAPELNDL